nr:hypothetical protein Ade03nite_34340 [Actinoplanes derwentensis]
MLLGVVVAAGVVVPLVQAAALRVRPAPASRSARVRVDKVVSPKCMVILTLASVGAPAPRGDHGFVPVQRSAQRLTDRTVVPVTGVPAVMVGVSRRVGSALPWLLRGVVRAPNIHATRAARSGTVSGRILNAEP